MADLMEFARENGIAPQAMAQAFTTEGDRLEKLHILLGLTDDSQDALLELALAAVEEMVLSYINQRELPQGLEHTLLIMAAAYYKGAALGSMDADGAVTAIKRGDTQITYGVGASPAAHTFDLNGGGGFLGWRTLLREYRVVRW